MKTLSKTEALIANLLSDANVPLYGLELVEHSEGALKRGTVYVTLGRMQDKGWLQAEVTDEGTAGMPRPRYRLTPEGARQLAAWRAVQRLLSPTEVAT